MNKVLNLSGYGFYWYNLKALLSVSGNRHFIGWGQKRSGRFAQWCAKRFNGSFTLLEDGFIRSLGLGVDGAQAMSLVLDDVGIYYDATRPSRLENLLNQTDFTKQSGLIEQAKQAIEFIQKHAISKYNHAPNIHAETFPELFEKLQSPRQKILVIAQTQGDASLAYGYGNQFSTRDLIQAAIDENPGAGIYLKIHPDVLSGKKASDIDLDFAAQYCILIQEDVNPIGLLTYFEKVYTKTSQMGFEALLLGKACVCFGVPFYAGWGLTDDRVKIERRERKLSLQEVFAAAYILYPTYYDSYQQKSSNLLEVLHTLNRLKQRAIPKADIAFFLGFSWWKRPYVKPFFRAGEVGKFVFLNPFKMPFCAHPHARIALDKALKRGLNAKSCFCIWGRKAFPEVEEYARVNQIKLYRIEDGFVRSISLGSDLTQPYSLVVDARGIYFDPTAASDLEHLLLTYDFQAELELLKRAEQAADYLVAQKLSKYNLYHYQVLSFPKGRKVILVPGQVEDDASIRFGAPGMTNLKLLQAVRKNCPDDYIVYKPHPDVLVGNRTGRIDQQEALVSCNQIVTEVSIDSVLEQAHEVHTLTSLVGFEALMRGKKVVTYGKPFYAGWGLTEDLQPCESRQRRLSLNELLAGVLLLYPRYINPKTHSACELEVVFAGLSAQREKIQQSSLIRFWLRLRNSALRKLQKTVRIYSR
ncbi:capsular polysaccharide biosynthesis protein [Thiosulfatimonas sediminis]|nr:capsular polysaccharide biosynthesis protein [Thiosulfatimonas sediminis]